MSGFFVLCLRAFNGAADVPFVCVEKSDRPFLVTFQDLANDRDHAAAKLFVRRLQIDHQILVHVTALDHSGGGEHIEDDLLRRACLHTRGARDHLGARIGTDVNICRLAKLGVGIVCD